MTPSIITKRLSNTLLQFGNCLVNVTYMRKLQIAKMVRSF